MKKSLIAVAALAAVGAASAQSSVTLYGVVDAGYGVERVKNKVTTVTGNVSATTASRTRTAGLISGGLSGSRWGLKGQEDLGNGLSAVFNVEAGFNSTNGAFNAGGFNRRSVVGLKGSFGQVLLGRDYTPVDSIAGDYQAISKVTEDELTKGFNTGRYSGVHYSGEFGGVGVNAFIGYDDKKTTSATGMTRTRAEGYGVGVSYSGGPVTVGAAVQQFRDKNATTTTRKNTEYGVGATYDFTAAKLYAHYLANDGAHADSRHEKPMQQFGVGVTVPFGAFTLGAQYAYNYWKAPAGVMVAGQATANNDKIKGHDFALEGTYALSKRTAFYARAARTNSWKFKNSFVSNGVRKTAQTHTDSFAVGLRHRF
ncbi:MAG: porin [Brachymonas sp.]|nr:porin [Brachymonas sp.]